MNYLVRAAFFALSLATIAPVAKAAITHSSTASDAAATRMEQTSSYGGGGNG